MTTLLSKAGSSLTVKLLLDTLQEVLDFEASIAKKYVTPVSGSLFLLIHTNVVLLPASRNSESHPTYVINSG